MPAGSPGYDQHQRGHDDQGHERHAEGPSEHRSPVEAAKPGVGGAACHEQHEGRSDHGGHYDDRLGPHAATAEATRYAPTMMTAIDAPAANPAW